MLSTKQITLIAITLSILSLLVSSLPLDDYVNLPDSSYKWELANTVKKEDHTLYVIRLTSQTYLAGVIDKSLWQHWVRIIVPDVMSNSGNAVMYINYGDNPLGNAPGGTESFLPVLATDVGDIVIELNQIPNQPLTFVGEDFSRSEDSILAKGWDLFIQTHDPIYITRLAMVKAAVRAMDSVQEFVESLKTVQVPQNFVVAGASKRGWTTWLTGAVDKRVIAVAPLVIDVLDMQPNFNEIWQTYGKWPAALNSYVEQNITRCLNCPVFNELASVEDPLVYIDRFLARNVPIFALNANGDEFFIPTGWQYWFNNYPGEKYVRYLPNAEHSLATAIKRVTNTMTAFVSTIDRKIQRPSFTWGISKDLSTITLKSDVKPVSVKLWQAYNRFSRAFILNCYLTCLWKSEELFDQGNGTYVGSVEIPNRGYTAYMLEVEYDVDFKYNFVTSTGVYIVPDEYEHPTCPDNECGLCSTC